MRYSTKAPQLWVSMPLYCRFGRHAKWPGIRVKSCCKQTWYVHNAGHDGTCSLEGKALKSLLQVACPIITVALLWLFGPYDYILYSLILRITCWTFTWALFLALLTSTLESGPMPLYATPTLGVKRAIFCTVLSSMRVVLSFFSVAMTTPFCALIPRLVAPPWTAVRAYSIWTSFPLGLKVVSEKEYCRIRWLLHFDS